MDLFEYQGKQFFAQYGMPVSPGQVAFTVDEAVAAAEELGTPVMVKAQVHTGGRGKAGGVKFAADIDAVREHATNILGLDIRGHVVKRIWIEKASDIAEEYYVSILLDRANRAYLAMASVEGGVEIEEVAATRPEALIRARVDALEGMTPQLAEQIAADANFPEAIRAGVANVLVGLWRVLTEEDATLVEVPPGNAEADEASRVVEIDRMRIVTVE